jgi:homoserine dehydrogenase
MNEKVVNVGLAGFGTVGAGVAKLIVENGDTIAAKTGIRLNLACVVDLDTDTPRPVVLPEGVLTNDMQALLSNDKIDIAVELIGGTGFAKTLQLELLKAGKHVVTANKALLAEHGPELYQVARDNEKCIAFEASCAGGIPIVSAMRTGLAANDIQGMYGIVNGTCNYILSNMSSKSTGFEETLAAAQAKGYAEADPTLDINGGDSTHKLAIMGSVAYGV